MILFLTALVATILLRTLHNDIRKYNECAFGRTACSVWLSYGSASLRYSVTKSNVAVSSTFILILGLFCSALIWGRGLTEHLQAVVLSISSLRLPNRARFLDSDSEETGWKLVSGDVFRRPSFSRLYSVPEQQPAAPLRRSDGGGGSAKMKSKNVLFSIYSVLSMEIKL